MIQANDSTRHVENIGPYMNGKTIKRIDESSVNCLNIEFTDGTELLLEVESVHGSMGLYGIIGYIKR